MSSFLWAEPLLRAAGGDASNPKAPGVSKKDFDHSAASFGVEGVWTF